MLHLGQQVELSLSPVFFLLPGITFLDQDGSKDQMDLFPQRSPHILDPKESSSSQNVSRINSWGLKKEAASC